MMNTISLAEFFPSHVWRRRAIGIAALWFFICLSWTAPAQLLVAILKPLAPALQLQDVDGGFWNGSAGQAFWQQDGKTIALGKTEWHINPWSLLWLHPSAHIATNYGEQFIDTRAQISPLGRVVLRDTSAAIPAQLIGNWLPLPAKGQLALKLARAEFSRQQLIAANGDIYWQQAQWQWGAHWLALGDYRCALHLENAETLHCALQGQGALTGNGDIAVDFNKRNWSADLKIKLEPSLPQEFRQTVTVMLAAKADPQGQLQVQRNGQW
ncbi:MAG: hypothetical protein JWM78_1143 [Verrucomicrobiaceae bacterium]|nr:hypothetical protein [Verrucomicrobiaceae bacterium]